MDLKIKDVATLLNISEKTIRRWLSQGKIPAYRLSGQYRFSRAEIEDWVMQQKIDVAEREEGPRTSEPSAMQFSLYRALSKGEVFSIGGETKEQVIRGAMVRLGEQLDFDAEVVAELFLERERLMPTALGAGVGVPHTRDFLLNTHFDAVAVIYPEQPIPYGALDGLSVHALFFLFACEDQRHLHLLAKVAHLVSSCESAGRLLAERAPKERLLETIKEWEAGLG